MNTDISTPDTASPYDLFHSIMMQRPEVGFSTEAIATILDNVGFTGKCILSDGSHPGVRFYQRKHDQCGPAGRASGSNHKRVTFGAGHLLIDSLSIPASGNAVIGLTGHGLAADHTTQPFVVAYNAALPASPVVDEQFTLGAYTVVGGVTINQVTNISIAWNPSFEKVQYGGSLWPTLFDIQKIRAVMTITTDDISLHDDSSKITRLGKACTHANSRFCLQRRQANAGLYAEDSEQHIDCSMAGFAYCQRVSASGGGTGSLEITVVTVDDGTNAPIVFATADTLD
jgi:hypothetical protein